MTTPHLRRSRILKALTDRGANTTYDASAIRLSEVKVVVVLGEAQCATAAGQACALTAALTAAKCFGHSTLVARGDTKLNKALAFGKTLSAVCEALDIGLCSHIPADASHVISIAADGLAESSVFVCCWWDNWCAGVTPAWESHSCGAANNPLAGIFAGALAVREVFATVLDYPRAGKRSAALSLWEPNTDADVVGSGPPNAFVPARLWFLGLGHLGQGLLWALGYLPVKGLLAVLQDDQIVGEENESTGLLTTMKDVEDRLHKARVAARWIEAAGWPTALLERRHYGDIPLIKDDPSIVISGLDDIEARLLVAEAGFDYMIDVGVGHGPGDFENCQIRMIKKGMDAKALWENPAKVKDIESVLVQSAYRDYERKFGACGARELAGASVAVPFVGAAVGAITIAQLLRLASTQDTAQFTQLELGSPGMPTFGNRNAPHQASFGTIEVRFA